MLIFRERRQLCIDRLHHWIENIHRDPGVIAPYLFVILSVLSLSMAELEWACVNSIRRRRQFLHLSGEKYMQMATSKDDSFPRLLEEFLSLRDLLFNHIDVITTYCKTYLSPLQARIQAIGHDSSASKLIQQLFGEESDENDWMRVAVQLKALPEYAPLPNLLWSYCLIHQGGTTPEVLLYRRSEIPHLAEFYPLMFAFCAENYTRKGNFDFQFLFLDLIDMICHSRQVASSKTRSLFATHRQLILDHVQTHTMNNVAVLFANQQCALGGERCDVWDRVDREELERCARMLQRYREVEKEGEWITYVKEKEREREMADWRISYC